MAHTINSRCNGCSACARQCPVDAVTGEFKVGYTVDAATCIDCGVCGAICPVDAVRDEFGNPVRRIPRALRPRPTVDADLCNGCGLCADVCPFGSRAVVGRHFDGVSFMASVHQCVACGECGRVCAKGAISMEKLDLRRHDPDKEAERLKKILKKSA